MKRLKRIELLLKDALYTDYIERNTQEEEGMVYCQHDLHHHIDVARIAYILVLEHNDFNYFVKEANLSSKLAAKEIIYAAGLLHDIGKWKEYQSGADHAAFGARLAHDILPRVFFNPNEIEIICRAIYEHRNISKDMSFLGERIHRADNLSRVCSQCDQHHHCPKLQTQEFSVTTFEY
ncbi:MAG: HD domain-containing protein [Bacillota bacterium]|nr:HD domain-containing protein [Bacillota bacterium]